MKFINLKQFRKEQGLTQQQLGQALRLPQSTISYLENGLQEVTDYLLSCIKQTFAIDNLDAYVYERKSFHNPEKSHLSGLERKEIFLDSEWNEIEPIDIIDGFPIICKNGRVNIAKNGTLLIDRNTGSGYCLSHYVISPDKFADSRLLLSMTEKKWFDDEILEDFKRAYFIGCRIVGIYPVQQLKDSITPKQLP